MCVMSHHIHCIRIPVTDACLPYLCSDDAGNVINWGSGQNALYLFNSDRVDIRAEGIRFLTSGSLLSLTATTNTTACRTERHTLCSSSSSALLPNSVPIVTHSGSDSVCGASGAGIGRQFVNMPQTQGSNQRLDLLFNVFVHLCCYNFFWGGLTGRYDISVCDVLASKYNLAYDPLDRRLDSLARPIGVMVYTLVLMLCSCNLAGVALHSTKQGVTALLLACAAFSIGIAGILQSVHHGGSVLLYEDLLYCIFTMTAGVLYICTLCLSTAGYRISTPQPMLLQGACLHALDALICAAYSTPENPYSMILAAFVCTRLWTLLYACVDSKKQGLANVLETAICTAHLVLLSELGVYPQLVLHNSWAAMAATVLFLGNTCVKVFNAP